MITKSNIAFFDFDGTITKKDSMLEFVKFVHGKHKFYIGILYLLPFLLAFKARIISNHKAKEKFIFYFFKRFTKQEIREFAEAFTDTLDQMVLANALERIAWHKKNKHEVVIVSASLDIYLNKWCKEKDIELIATRLMFQNEALSSAFATKNCYGKEKVNRIKQQYNLSQYDQIFVYGNSRGDKEMLSLATQKFYNYFY